jgi:general secretion pathway protein D
MKHQKKIYTLAVLVSLLNESSAQINKYRSRTRFNPTSGSDAQGVQTFPATDPTSGFPSTMPPSFPPDSSFVPPGSAQALDEDFEADEFETNNADSGSELEDEANVSTFGDRVKSAPLSEEDRKKEKYVNLNPETAYGPEIVQSFDFPDTDILELTKHMQKLTGINLILDKDVKGKVSIIAPTPITVGDAWKAYLTALNMAGFTLVKSGAFYKVMQARDIRYTPTKIYTGNYTPDTENYVMRVIALKNVSAVEIARNFRPFMSRYGRIIDIKQTNTVIMADTGVNINRLVKMVKFLDVPGHEETLQIVKVKNSSAQEIAKLLDSILKGGSGNSRPGVMAQPRFAGGSESTSKASISRIIAEPRTNSIIAMANADGAKQLNELIAKLDVKFAAGGSGRVHVYYLNYGDSEELAKTLSAIVSGNVAQNQQGGGANNNNATRFTSTSGTQADNAIFSAEVKITSDKNNNALVVTASPTDWLTLKDVVRRLDIPRDQVYVEGLILEAQIEKNNGFGVNFVGAYGQSNAQRAGLPSGNLWNLLSGNPQTLNGFFAGIGGGGTRTVNVAGQNVKVSSVNALITAIATHTNSNVLATPQILALDNTEATFEVGNSVPIQNAVNNGTQTAFNTTEQQAVLSLKITPQINKVTRFVKLKINKKMDDFQRVDPSIAQRGGGVPKTLRSATTEVMVRDRDTIAMGGLLRDTEVTTFSKVPLLGDIPVLGWLFKSQTREIKKLNLLFFMTPKILAPYDKTASANTLDVMQKRDRGMLGITDKDNKDPADQKMKELRAKVDLQTQGPLFDEEDAALYKNLNEKSVTPQRNIENEEENSDGPSAEETAKRAEASVESMDEMPNYQEIKAQLEQKSSVTE